MSSSGEHSSGPTAGLAALYSFKCKMRNGYGLRASPPLSLPLTRPILVPSFLGVLSFRGVLSFLGVLSFVWRRFMSLRFCATGPSRSRLHLTRAAGHNDSPPVACVAGIVNTHRLLGAAVVVPGLPASGGWTLQSQFGGTSPARGAGPGR